MDSAGPACFGLDARQSLAVKRLDLLAASPPQVLVLEGGLAPEREAAALYYAAACNCPSGAGACGTCPSCRQMLDKVHMDLIFLDGREQSIKVDEIREVRQKVGEPPRGPGWRVVILTEAQGLTTQAANALLKSMEEPRPGNCFVLLAPQRERLLPTLVSRSWTLTLPWPGSAGSQSGSDEAHEWLNALDSFWRTGRGLFPKTGAKGRLTRNTAQAVLLALSRELAQVLSGRPGTGPSGLFANRLDLEGLRRLDLLLASAQEALVGQISPALTLEWLATRVYLWLH
jgi:DNA polymerase III subunit delta'